MKLLQKVVIIQRLLAQYRRPFYELLRERLAGADIELVLIHGSPSEGEALKRDGVEITWAHHVKDRCIKIGQHELYWQPCLKHIRGADYEFSRRANINGYNLLINYEAVVISNVKMTGLNNRVNKLGWSDLIRSFFSIKSTNNLINRCKFAWLCCASWQFPVYYICSVVRVIIGSLLYQTGLRNR
jgi:hypothetical protein